MSSWSGSGTGSSSTAPGSNNQSKGVILIWDLNTCNIPGDLRLEGVLGNIAKAIKTKIEKIHIFCADPEVRESYEGITEYAPDISVILSMTQASTRHVLLITGDTKYCPTVSRLRQHNLYVGIACLTSHYKALQKVACYARDWSKIIVGNKNNYFIEPRNTIIEPDMNHCMMYPVFVYWDLQTCPIQKEFRKDENLMLSLTEKFQGVLRDHNYWGYFKVYTYGLLNHMKAIHYQSLRNNAMKFQSVAQGTKGDASKMILNDICSRLTTKCEGKSCFMIISDGDVKSASRAVVMQRHDLILARSSSSSSPSIRNATMNLEWPIFWQK